MTFTQIFSLEDDQGLTALHHALRWAKMLPVIEQLLRRFPELVTKCTKATGRPGHWSALHVLADVPVKADDQKVVADIGRLLVNRMRSRDLDCINTPPLLAMVSHGKSHTTAICLRKQGYGTDRDRWLRGKTKVAL